MKIGKPKTMASGYRHRLSKILMHLNDIYFPIQLAHRETEISVIYPKATSSKGGSSENTTAISISEEGLGTPLAHEPYRKTISIP